MADWDDVRRIALALPETSEQSSRGVAEWRVAEWRVKDKGFVWERPLRRADIEALGDAAPDGPILAARLADVGVKDELIIEAWLARAPKRLAKQYFAEPACRANHYGRSVGSSRTG